jgi:hypothetical protein
MKVQHVGINREDGAPIEAQKLAQEELQLACSG